MKLMIKNMIFTLLVPGTVAVFVPVMITKENVLSLSLISLLGCLLWIIGLVVYCCCVWDFAILGKGTPAPVDAPKNLVIRGLYRYFRNPMYIGILSILLGWVCVFTSPTIWLYWFSVAICFQLLVLYYEEPKLLQLFGSEYEAYCSSVNRWFPTSNDS